MIEDRPTPQEMARRRDNLPPEPTAAQRAQRNVRAMVTLRSKDEYEAAAMLLGMKYSKLSHSFYHNNKRGGKMLFRHPDTIEPLTAAQVRKRRDNIVEHGDAEYKDGG